MIFCTAQKNNLPYADIFYLQSKGISKMTNSNNVDQPQDVTSSNPNKKLDTLVHAEIAKITGSLSPTSTMLAFQDWFAHLLGSPGKQMELAQLATIYAEQLANYASQLLLHKDGEQTQITPPIPVDRRFSAPEWQTFPYNLMQQSFLLSQQWWNLATTDIAAVSNHHANVVNFWMRQFLELFSPGNQFFTNPQILAQTLEENGANLLRGMQKLYADVNAILIGEEAEPDPNFQVGKHVAVTKGKVILRNQVMELIQYTPTTTKVHPEPILLVPAWIMKYYILDLSPHNSLVKYLLDQGHTVFCISWKNPDENDRNLAMEDYLQNGFFAALDAVNAVVPKQKVHAAGYCLGGTLLAIAASSMARDEDNRLATISFFAAQTDFTEPGEIGLFIDESQINLLEAQMERTGYLKASQMAGAFQMLRSYDLLWSRLINEYLLGKISNKFDIMAWNADATRMPAKMHAHYLRSLFLNNDLSEGRYKVGDKAISLANLNIPIFMVGTVTDHVAPWKSVYKLHYLTAAEITFVLTTGGHNVGIVNPPSPTSKRKYQLLTRKAGGVYISPDEWQKIAKEHQGSWWSAWQAWVSSKSGTLSEQIPTIGAGKYQPITDAPGEYVLVRA